ncbi:MAG: hypothetical protein KDA77_22335, partial [Planctomycetaceae bacterium]|nr:hypothetical protein [Planctomycetaceae bacterium]
LIQGLILNNHQAGADVLLTLGAVASRYLKKELIQEVFDSYRTGESPVPPEHLPAIGDLNEVMQDAPTADLLDASAAAPETPLPVLPHPVAVIKSALEELEREFPRIQELRQEFVRLKTFFEDVEPGQDDFSVLQVFRLAALADRWDAFWDNHIRYQIGRPQDFGADSGNFVRHELMTGTRHEWGFGVRNLVARLTEQSIRDPLNNLVSNQLKRLSTDLLSHVQEVQTVGEAYGLFLARESLGKVPEVRFQDADGVSVNFFSGIGYLKAKKRFDLPVGSVAYDEAQNLITFTLPKSELRIAPPADASVPPSAANDVASAYSRVTAPESRATSDEFRRIEVNYELFDTDAEGTITMPVAAFAEIAQQTVSADEDLKAEALAKMDALAVAANRWHNVQLILYAEGS